MSAQSPNGVGFLEHAENADEAIADVEEAREITAEQERQERQERTEEMAADQSTQAWLETEVESDVETFPFRGREFEFRQPGLLHIKPFLTIAAESNPSEYNDIDPADEEAVEEALEETVTAEGLKGIGELLEHTLRCLCDLVVDDHLGDTSNLPDGVSPLHSEEMPAGALRWGQLPEDDVLDEDGNVKKQGLGTLVQRTVVRRSEDLEDDVGN